MVINKNNHLQLHFLALHCIIIPFQIIISPISSSSLGSFLVSIISCSLLLFLPRPVFLLICSFPSFLGPPSSFPSCSPLSPYLGSVLFLIPSRGPSLQAGLWVLQQPPIGVGALPDMPFRAWETAGQTFWLHCHCLLGCSVPLPLPWISIRIPRAMASTASSVSLILPNCPKVLF